MNRSQTVSHLIGSPAALVGLLLVSAATSSAAAGEHHFVMRDGTKVPMTYSQTEIGVILRPEADSKSAKARFKGASAGELVDIIGAADSRMKLLRVTKATAKRRDFARQDRAIERVGKVYRFQGSPGPVLGIGQLVVKLQAGLSAEQRQAIWTEFSLQEVKSIKGLADVYTVGVSADADEVLLAERLADDGRTLWAHPDFIQMRRTLQVIPSDPLFDQQWHLSNTGQLPGSLVDADIDAPEAWAIADGSGVLFSMFDDSCDVDHEDLRDQYIGIGQDISLPSDDPDEGNPRPKRLSDFHGTAVMGLAVASGNSVGVRGVSFRSTFTATRGLGEFVPDSAIATSYLFAVAQSVDVHINSWGTVFPRPNSPILAAAIETAFLTGRDLDGDGGDEPLGMPIFFAAGNGNFFTGIGEENQTGFELSTLPTVIGVGATSAADTLASFSNFGRDINFVAPGAADILTVDNQDTSPGPGMNRGGFRSNPDFGFLIGDQFGFAIPQADLAGNYNSFFSGTSAACPIAAGVAGLVLSVNPALTATEVRIVMEHTCDKVDVENAEYNGITNRSLRYGYGRVNARGAVLAAEESLANGGVVWPEVPSDVGVIGSTLSWIARDNMNDFLVVSAQRDFDFIPVDGGCYDASQPGCAAAEISALPADVSVLFAGCSDGTACAEGTEQSVAFDPPEFGRLFFAVFSLNANRQYSFGVPIDSIAGTSGGETGDEMIRPPAVTISAAPLRGVSPLTVRFNGNAVGALEIDGNRTEWNFDVVADDDTLVDSTVPESTHTFIVAPGETKKFTARLKMFDVVGNEGSASVQIRVAGPAQDSPSGEATAAEVSIGIAAVSTVDPRCETEVCGTSPFGVLYRVDTSESNVALSVQSIVWDLGDGTASSSQSVSHTYVNESDVPFVMAVTATIAFISAEGATVPRSVTSLITVLPGSAIVDPEDPDLPGTEVFGDGGVATPCGIITILPMLGCFGGLFWMRRRGG